MPTDFSKSDRLLGGRKIFESSKRISENHSRLGIK
jgi:hypothetical protein